MSETKVLKSHKASGRPEDSINFITYALAALLSFVGLVFLLLKTVPTSAIGSVASIIYVFFTAAVFTVGALCHILPQGSGARKIAARIDRSFACVLSAAVFTPIMLVGLAGGNNSDAVWGYVLFSVIWAGTIAAIVINIVNIGERKIVSLILYVVVMCACVVRIDRMVDLYGMGGFWFLFGGYIAYLCSIVAPALNVPAGHALRHAFAVVGAALHFVCIFSYLL